MLHKQIIRRKAEKIAYKHGHELFAMPAEKLAKKLDVHVEIIKFAREIHQTETAPVNVELNRRGFSGSKS